MRTDVDVDEVGSFIVATYEGYLSLAKNFQDVSVLRSGVRNMVGYVESLRMPGSRGAQVLLGRRVSSLLHDP